MSLLYRFQCDGCGIRSDESLYLRELQIRLAKYGWWHEPATDPAVMDREFCPRCHGGDA